jgi:hypothetical protein
MTFFALIVREANIRILLARYLAQTVVLESMVHLSVLQQTLNALSVREVRQALTQVPSAAIRVKKDILHRCPVLMHAPPAMLVNMQMQVPCLLVRNVQWVDKEQALLKRHLQMDARFAKRVSTPWRAV